MVVQDDGTFEMARSYPRKPVGFQACQSHTKFFSVSEHEKNSSFIKYGRKQNSILTF